MAHIKRTSWIILFFACAFVLGGVVFRAFSEEDVTGTGNFTNVELDIETDRFILFDQNTGRIYSYNNTDGRMREMWQIERLGASLRKLTKTGERW